MKLIVMILSCLVALPALAQTDEFKDLPGYVDFGELTAVYGEPRVEINLGKSMLGLIGAFETDDDIQNLYHINPPEFRLPEDQYELLDEARQILSEHKPEHHLLQLIHGDTELSRYICLRHTFATKSVKHLG